MSHSSSPFNRPSRRLFLAGSATAALSSIIRPGRALAADAEVTLKVASVAPSGTPWSVQLGKIKQRIKDGSGGRMRLKTYLGGALGDEISTLERCKRGQIHIWAGTSGALSSVVPEIACLELPYLFPDREAADAILDRHVKGEIEKLLESRGLKLLFYSENGYRSIGTNFGFVRSPADLRGKKMRAQQSFVHLNTWRALGASPIPIAVTEALTSLQTGVVDGFDNTPLFTFAASWYQSITHFSLTRHCYQPGFVVVSKAAWDKLPADLQTLLMGDPQAEATSGRAMVRALDPQLIANFGAAGIPVHDCSASERAAFAKATAGVHDKFGKKYGRKLLNAVKKQL